MLFKIKMPIVVSSCKYQMTQSKLMVTNQKTNRYIPKIWTLQCPKTRSFPQSAKHGPVHAHSLRTTFSKTKRRRKH